MKKITGILLALCMVFVLSGCNAITIDGEGQARENAGNGSIGLSVSTLNNPFFVSLADGAKAAAKEKGVSLAVADAGDDSAKQQNDIEDLISRNVSVLIVNPVDSDAVAPAVQNAISKGVKVISVDRVVNGVDVDCQIASDNVAGARMATEYLASQIGEGAKIAELQGVPGASATIDRGAGFHEAADKTLNVVASQSANFDRAEGMSVMENILQSDGSNELPRSRAAGYLRGGSTTYNPISSTVLAPVRFDRVSYTLFLVLVLLHILISPLHFHAPLLWQHNIRLSKILLPIIFSSPVDTLQILLWLLYFSLFV